MIILYDKNEQAFTSLGIGVLDDAISCVVTEELNGIFELEMDYPITGVHYSDLQERKIIYAKANDILGQQPFRIYKITRPIDGTVTVYAEHISYDMSSVPVRKISANNLNELAGPNGKIQNGKVINSPFMFYVADDKQSANDVYYKTTKPYNMRSLLMGSDESILNIYNGEFIFDKFNVTLCDRRGSDRGFTIRYSKNMTDLEQETSSELMYDGILPYYSNTTTETKVGIGKKYVEIYIADKNVQPLTDIDGQQVFPTTWLTYKSSGLEPIKEIAKLSVVNIIATEGEYYNHLVSGKRTKLSENDEAKSYFIDVTYNIAYINKSFPNEFKYGWLYKDEDITKVWQPTNGQLFRIFTPGDKLYKVYIFEGDTQTGVYREIDEKKDDVKEYGPTIPSPDTTQEEKETLLQYEGDIIYINEVRALPKEGQTQTSPTWLYKIKEVEQLVNSDPRWEPIDGGDIVQTMGIPSTIIYKVPRDEEGIVAYPIDGVKVDDPGWLTLYEGSTEPLMPDGVTPFVPVDQQLYNVVKPASQGGGFSKRRWFEEQNKYAMATDTRCLYTNYEWNGTKYVEHSTVNDKILTLDMSDNFKEVPSPSARFQKNLYEYTLKYIEDNKLGTLKNSIKVSFVKLSSSPEYSKWKELETVVLGDTVHVIYEELGVNEQKKVIKTEYNVLTETYDSIEIGDKGKQFVDKAVVSGDDISALTNDRNFADITTVTKLIANTIDAEYIHAVTAELSNAQIDTLTAGDVTARIVTAEKFDIDNLVASLLTADDAAIRNTLVVGDNLIVNGEVNIINGSISISGQERIDSARTAYYNPEKTVEDVDFLLSDPNDASSVIMPEIGIWYKVIDQLNLPHYYIWQLPTDEEDGKYIEKTIKSNVYFEVDESGNAKANSLTITGGSITIEDPEGNSSFEVTNAGALKAKEAEIEGKITATSGKIGDCTIDEHGHLIVPSANVTGTFSANVLNGGTITGCEISIGPISGTNPTQYNFEVDSHGDVTANSITITGGSINLSGANSTFGVDQNGNLNANSVTLTGGTIENLNITGTIYFGNKNMVYAYIRGQHIQYEHRLRFVMDEGAADHDLEVCEVVLPKIDYNSSSYVNSGFYLSDLFDVGVEFLLDTISRFNYRMIIEARILYDDEDIWFQYYDHDGDYVWDLASADKKRWTDERLENVLEITKDTVTDITSYTSSWLSVHDPSTDGQDGEPLTPDPTKTYIVYDDSGRIPGHQNQFIGMYKWVNNKFVLQSNYDIYCINEDGLHLPGIDATIDETKIASFTVDEYKMVSTNLPDTAPSDPDTEFNEVGISAVQSEEYAFWVGKIKYPSQNNQGLDPDPVFYVTHEGYMKATSGMISSYKMYNAFVFHDQTLGDIYDDILSTNEEKVNMYDNEDGIAITSLGIGLYDGYTNSKVTISPFTGITTTTLTMDPFRKFTSRFDVPFQPGTLPMAFFTTASESDMKFMADMHGSEFNNPDYLSIDDAFNIQYMPYATIVKGIEIPRASYITLVYANKKPSGTHDILPLGPIQSKNLHVSTVFAINTLPIETRTPTQLVPPMVAIDEDENLIKIYNTNSYDITSDLLVIFINDEPLPVPNVLDPWKIVKHKYSDD